MKNKMILFLLMTLSIFQLYLIKDSGIFHVVSRMSFVLFFLFSFINSFFKKEGKLNEKVFLFTAFLNIVYSFASIFTVDVSTGIYNTVVSMMGYYLFNKIFKKKENMNRLLLCVYILNIIPSLLIKEFNYSVIYLIVFGLFLLIFFWRGEEKKNKQFKLYKWYKHISLISVAIIYVYYPIVGGILAGIVGFFSFAGVFEIYNKKRENTIYDKRVRNNPRYILTRKIYHYASSKNEFFNEQLKLVGKDSFLEEEIPYELYAIMGEIDERSNEGKLVLRFNDKEEMKDKTRRLVDSKVRPEVVVYMIMEGIKEKENLSEKEKDKLYKKLKKILSNFEDKYVGIIKEISEDTLENVLELYASFDDDLMKEIGKMNIKKETN